MIFLPDLIFFIRTITWNIAKVFFLIFSAFFLFLFIFFCACLPNFLQLLCPSIYIMTVVCYCWCFCRLLSLYFLLNYLAYWEVFSIVAVNRSYVYRHYYSMNIISDYAFTVSAQYDRAFTWNLDFSSISRQPKYVSLTSLMDLDEYKEDILFSFKVIVYTLKIKRFVLEPLRVRTRTLEEGAHKLLLRSPEGCRWESLSRRPRFGTV